MSSGIDLMDLALALGERELEALRDERVEEAQELASERGEAMRKAFEAPPGDDVEAFRERLHRMNHLQDRLTLEARRLHGEVRERMKGVKKESKRMAGYGKAAQRMPGTSRFISKRS